MSEQQKLELWCEPWNAGLASEPAAVGRRLGELLTALGRVDSNIVRGTRPDELREFRLALHDKLTAAGWRIKARTGDGWKVLPPEEPKAKRKRS